MNKALRALQRFIYGPTEPPRPPAEWEMEAAFWRRRFAALNRHASRLTATMDAGEGLGYPSYQPPPSGVVNCRGSIAIGTGCRTCSACLHEIAILETGPCRFAPAGLVPIPIDNPMALPHDGGTGLTGKTGD